MPSLIMSTPNFNDFAPNACYQNDWEHLLTTLSAIYLPNQSTPPKTLADTWVANAWVDASSEQDKTDWLIGLFNHLFDNQNTVLVRGGDEPEYFAATATSPAQICFAHGYFASALHEISHWCIAGKQRRQLDDFGYWYCPDGRDKPTQTAFEQVEIKPQAIECLLTHATANRFFVSADNLNADFDTSDSTFASDVYHQALAYLQHPLTLPKDAQKLLVHLLVICQNRPSDLSTYQILIATINSQ